MKDLNILSFIVTFTYNVHPGALLANAVTELVDSPSHHMPPEHSNGPATVDRERRPKTSFSYMNQMLVAVYLAL